MDEYTTESIVSLDSIAAVRKRPGMYVGDTSNGDGLHRILWELVDEALDEHVVGAAARVSVAIEDDCVVVSDDGRGLPVGRMPDSDTSALEVIFTTLSAWHRMGGRQVDFERRSLFGMGYTVVNALSRALEVETHSDGRGYRMAFERGRPTTGLVDLGETSRVGTRVRIIPDFDLFEPVPWDHPRIRRRLWDLACLTPGVAVVLNGEVFRAPQGLAAWVNAHREVESERPTVHLYGNHEGVRVEVALRWVEENGSQMAWANRHATPYGTHIHGFWTGVRDVFAPEMTPQTARELLSPRLVAAVHVTLDDPRFATQTLQRLDTPEAATAVAHVLRNQLPSAFGTHAALVERRRIGV